MSLSSLVLDGDYSDPDVIRVDDTYWMITSTIHCSPGMAVLRSGDLRVFEHVGHCIPDLTLLGPSYAHAGMGSRFGRGVYAGSIRFHAGHFWVHFTTLDEGIFVITADHPAGPWSTPLRLTDETMWDDPCPLWTSDGESWLVASRPGPEKWFTHLIPMAPDGLSIDLAGAVVLDEWHTSEGNKIYAIDGSVFVLHNEVRAPGHRLAVIMRASSVHGPWEKRILWEGQGLDRDREPNQGALVDHADGSWSFVTHHGRCGYPEGRPVSVYPLRWEDGWPVVVGQTVTPQSAGAGVGSPSPADDQFTHSELGPVWEWTNAPVGTHWTLTERPGHLRLRGHPSARADGLVTAANLCTQRLRSAAGSARVTVDASALLEGTVSGLCVYSTTEPVGIGVCRRDGALWAVLIEGARLTYGVGLVESVVELRVDLDDRGFASFATRTGSGVHTPLGDSYPARFAHYRGARLGLFCLGQTTMSGHADFIDFRYASPPAS